VLLHVRQVGCGLCRGFRLGKTGNRIAARIAMIAMTTNNSISVNARFIRVHLLVWKFKALPGHCTTEVGPDANDLCRDQGSGIGDEGSGIRDQGSGSGIRDEGAGRGRDEGRGRPGQGPRAGGISTGTTHPAPTGRSLLIRIIHVWFKSVAEGDLRVRLAAEFHTPPDWTTPRSTPTAVERPSPRKPSHGEWSESSP